MYADNITGSLKTAIETCGLRRSKQMDFNAAHGITPKSVSRPIQEPLVRRNDKIPSIKGKSKTQLKEIIDNLQKQMLEAADRLDFERAALLRDQIKLLRK